MARIAADELEAWRDNGMTQNFFAALEGIRAKAKADWLALSWDAETPSLDKLAYLKARAELVDDLLSLSASDLEELIEEHHAEG